MAFTVHGKPAPQGSKVRNAHGALYESSKAVGPWREAVRAETQRHVTTMMTGPADVRIAFLVQRPAGHYRTGRNAHLLRDGAPGYPAGKPDIDKLARAVLDGLTEGGAWKDDSQVVTLALAKRYADPGEHTGCYIEIRDGGADHEEPAVHS